MGSNCFLRQEATSEIISNVADFCSECYEVIVPSQVIFYDMDNYRFICKSCQESINKQLEKNCEALNTENSPLFN
jgi:hypothetical protein